MHVLKQKAATDLLGAHLEHRHALTNDLDRLKQLLDEVVMLALDKIIKQHSGGLADIDTGRQEAGHPKTAIDQDQIGLELMLVTIAPRLLWVVWPVFKLTFIYWVSPLFGLADI
ncbi:hypothetical protein D3C79_977910 [compost metagenome]